MADIQPRKFMFDRSFDGGGGHVHAPERKPVTLKPEQVDAMKKEAYEEGLAAGQKAAIDAQADQMAQIVARLDQRMQHLMENSEAAHKKQESAVGNVVLAIARKLLPDFVAKNGLQEIQALLGAIITEMVHEPRLVVRTNKSQFDVVNTRVTELSTQKAYAGKIVVLADPEIAVGDCRIEWADGGVERDMQATWKNVEQTLAPEAMTPEPIRPEPTQAISN